MRFLRPELHVQLNSPDDDQVDAAEEAIDRASDQYNRRWEQVRPQLPPDVVRFHDEQFLHDADVFAPARLPNGEVVLVAQQVSTLNADALNTLIFLHYVVLDEPRVEIPVPSEVFGRVQPHWLWDEFDMEAPGVFTHSILFSDGRVVTIRFRDFHYHLADIIAPEVLKILGAVPSAKAASA